MEARSACSEQPAPEVPRPILVGIEHANVGGVTLTEPGQFFQAFLSLHFRLGLIAFRLPPAIGLYPILLVERLLRSGPDSPVRGASGSSVGAGTSGPVREGDDSSLPLRAGVRIMAAAEIG